MLTHTTWALLLACSLAPATTLAAEPDRPEVREDDAPVRTTHTAELARRHYLVAAALRTGPVVAPPCAAAVTAAEQPAPDRFQP